MTIEYLKSIFIHIPKCGGSSVVNIWAKDDKLANHERSWPRWIRQNSTPLQFPRETLHARLRDHGPYKTYFVFTIIRDPKDLFESYYSYLLKWRGHANMGKLLRDFRGQQVFDLLCDAKEANRILMFERLAEDWQKLQKIIPIGNLPHNNRSKREPFNWNSGDLKYLDRFYDVYDALLRDKSRHV